MRYNLKFAGLFFLLISTDSFASSELCQPKNFSSPIMDLNSTLSSSITHINWDFIHKAKGTKLSGPNCVSSALRAGGHVSSLGAINPGILDEYLLPKCFIEVDKPVPGDLGVFYQEAVGKYAEYGIAHVTIFLSENEVFDKAGPSLDQPFQIISREILEKQLSTVEAVRNKGMPESPAKFTSKYYRRDYSLKCPLDLFEKEFKTIPKDSVVFQAYNSLELEQVNRLDKQSFSKEFLDQAQVLLDTLKNSETQAETRIQELLLPLILKDIRAKALEELQHRVQQGKISLSELGQRMQQIVKKTTDPETDQAINAYVKLNLQVSLLETFLMKVKK